MDVSISGDPFMPEGTAPATQEDPMAFPAGRYSEAGATPDEVARLQAQFDALSEPVQQATLDRLAGVAQGDLLAELETLREPPEVEKLDERKWTHDETDEVFTTKREATADAAEVAEAEPAPASDAPVPAPVPEATGPQALPAAQPPVAPPGFAGQANL